MSETSPILQSIINFTSSSIFIIITIVVLFCCSIFTCIFASKHTSYTFEWLILSFIFGWTATLVLVAICTFKSINKTIQKPIKIVFCMKLMIVILSIKIVGNVKHVALKTILTPILVQCVIQIDMMKNLLNLQKHHNNSILLPNHNDLAFLFLEIDKKCLPCYNINILNFKKVDYA